MKAKTPPTVKLEDYRPPNWTVRHTALEFDLHPTRTRVRSQLSFEPLSGGDLHLDGSKLKHVRAAIDGRDLPAEALQFHEEGLTIAARHLPEGPFTFEAEVEIDPSSNTELEGLYLSNGMYCTQCEAEGFRKITWYPDRPDVMATFDVTIRGNAPVKLSNGNPAGEGQWHDPWPKPSYLFALVAGDLVAQEDSFTTMSGRPVQLKIWVRPGDEDRCAYAMDALKRAMRWDEEEYGREYDLDIFQIVAVDDFNMGAMENKGLNIFNSKYVLASPATATDRDFEFIEGIVAHEYFHNWTGNRITCRDWFQLCLKEGLTVFRDQQFSEAMRSAPVERIGQVETLRARQFREDAGPLAHPVRPREYAEINNFYTATVYEKGAEVVRMLRTLVGPEGYRRALDLYFERHDGQAITVEDWLKVFEDACAVDLSQFALWYDQAGTPRVTVRPEFDGDNLRLHVSQVIPPTPGQPEKRPQVIPLRVGFLNPDTGEEAAPEELLVLAEARQTFVIEGFDQAPVLSLNRGFTAPIILDAGQTEADRLFLLAHDTDPFNRWEAGRAIALDLIRAMAERGAEPDAAFLAAMGRLARDGTLDPAFRALALSLPGEEAVAQATAEAGAVPDPEAIHEAREALAAALARALEADLRRLHAEMAVPGPYSPDAEAAGRRSLRNLAMSLLTRIEPEAETATARFEAADNMTDELAALTALVHADRGSEALKQFYARWQDDRLVVDKWFSVQAMASPPEVAVERVAALTGHPAFEWKNPNRFRALIGAFAMSNPAGFHRADGAGYRLVADWLIRLDPVNPQTAARLAGAFETWARYDDRRKALMRAELERIAAVPELSRDLAEMVGRMLG